MTDTLKSVLFVDYDSLHLALRARDPALGRRFAARPGALLEAIEAGTLIGSGSLGNARRRILMRRCYADPRLIGKARDSFVTQGFQIVDCPTLPGHERNSAEVQITLDTIDALGHPTAFDEFILLGAESDFTPLIYRLRAHNRAVSIFAANAAAGSYRAIADGIVDEGALVALLAGLADGDSEEEQDDDGPRPVAGRDDLAGLARRIHNATNVPLFAPKVYAELFRALTDEIAENGYHFQQTAENVAGRLIAGGRRASRRQVAFVVKGLALKGHVFSQSDTPQRLAEAFREQVLYLARHAGIEIDPRVERQVQGWIAGGSLASDPVEPSSAAPASGTDTSPSVDPVQAALAVEAEAMAGPLEADEPSTAPSGDVDLPTLQDGAVEPDEDLSEASPTIEVESIEPEGELPVTALPVPVDEDLAALADSPESVEEAEEEPVAPAVAIEPPAVRAAPAVRPPVPRGAPQRGGARPAEAPLDPFESSLLAAIAEAVQAVEPGKSGTAPQVAPVVAGGRIEPSLELPPVELEPKARTDGKSAAEVEAEADIGDEIQRILAAYNQGRKPAG